VRARPGRDGNEPGREFVKARRDNPPQKVSPAGHVVFDRDDNPVYDDAVSLAAAPRASPGLQIASRRPR
jgi:hypothetical protein